MLINKEDNSQWMQLTPQHHAQLTINSSTHFHHLLQWLKLSPDEVKEQIFKLAKKGLNPSQIGVVLRDSYGVAQVKNVTSNKILRILKSKGMTELMCTSYNY